MEKEQQRVGESTAPVKKDGRKGSMPKKRRVSMDIKLLQRSTDFLIPRLSFERLVKEVLCSTRTNCRIGKEATEALQESSEMYITTLFEDARLLAEHCKRNTINPADLILAQYFSVKSQPEDK